MANEYLKLINDAQDIIMIINDINVISTINLAKNQMFHNIKDTENLNLSLLKMNKLNYQKNNIWKLFVIYLNLMIKIRKLAY